MRGAFRSSSTTKELFFFEFGKLHFQKTMRTLLAVQAGTADVSWIDPVAASRKPGVGIVAGKSHPWTNASLGGNIDEFSGPLVHTKFPQNKANK